MCLNKKKMLITLAPVWNSTCVDLDEPNGTINASNKTADWRGGDGSGVGNVGGGGSVSRDFWWEVAGEGENPPVVKFGPDLGLLQAVGVYVNFLVFVAALALAVAVVCWCVAAKVRLSLNRRSGPEIAFQFGASNDVINSVVVAGTEGRRRGEDGNHTGDTH